METKNEKIPFFKWYCLVRKKVRQGIFPINCAGQYYEVVHCYFDNFSGRPMIGCYDIKEDDHVGLPACMLYDSNYEMYETQTETESENK